MHVLAERFLTVSRAAHPVPLASGGLAFSYDLAGHPQVFSVDAPGGWPIRVGAGSQRTLPIAETPLGLLVRQDQGGNEAWQVGLAGPDGLHLLTRDPKAMNMGVVLSPEGRRVGLARNPDGQVDMVLGVLDLETRTIEDWADPGGLWQWQGWHPDGTVGLAEKFLGSNRVESGLVGRGEPLRLLLPGAHMVTGAAFTSEGRLFALTDHDADFAGLAELDPERPESPPRWVLKPDHDVHAFLPDPSGRTAVVAVNMGAYDRLLRVDLAGGRELEVYDLPPGTVYQDNVSPPDTQLRWSLDGSSLFVTWNTPVQPADIFQLGVGTPRRWTFSGERLPGAVMPEETSYRTFDGLEIPALHFKAGPGSQPTVVYFHGGPEGQFRGSFGPSQGAVQMFVAAGISVFAPNVRGSSGYGLRYLSLDDRALRWDSVRDGCEAARHLKREGLATTTAAMGASYGGFMTLAVLVEDPELWDAACDIVGIADWRTFLKNTSGWRRAARVMEYGDPEGAEKEVLAEFSPLARAHTIRAPLLVLHGRNDPRVPVSEAEQIAAATGAELIIFEDEGHGLARHANRLLGYGRALAFFQERLAGREPAGQAAS